MSELKSALNALNLMNSMLKSNLDEEIARAEKKLELEKNEVKNNG